MAEDDWKTKCKQLKKKVLQVEENNKVAALAVSRSKVVLNRLRLEYSVLLERLESRVNLPESEEEDEEEEEIELVERKDLKRKKNTAPQYRDPDMPKRPLNPYLMFCDLEKDKLKREAEAEGKDIDLSKALGEKWRGMSSEEKQPYLDLYNTAKEKFNQDMKEYEENLPKKQKLEAQATESPVPEQ